MLSSRLAIAFALCEIVLGTRSDDYLHRNAIKRSTLTGHFSGNWERLNNSLEGRLIAGKPVALPCFSTHNGSFSNAFNSDTCQLIRDNYVNESESSVFIRWTTYANGNYF